MPPLSENSKCLLGNFRIFSRQPRRSAVVSETLVGVPFRGSFALISLVEHLSPCRDDAEFLYRPYAATERRVQSPFCRVRNFTISRRDLEIDDAEDYQLVPCIFPARYYVVCLQTIFMGASGCY